MRASRALLLVGFKLPIAESGSHALAAKNAWLISNAIAVLTQGRCVGPPCVVWDHMVQVRTTFSKIALVKPDKEVAQVICAPCVRSTRSAVPESDNTDLKFRQVRFG